MVQSVKLTFSLFSAKMSKKDRLDCLTLRFEVVTKIREKLYGVSLKLLKKLLFKRKEKKTLDKKWKKRTTIINWIIKKITNVKTSKTRRYFEKHPKKIGREILYPTRRGRRLPSEMMYEILKFLPNCKETLDNVGLATHLFHTSILCSWKHLVVNERNYKMIPIIIWRAIQSVRIGPCSYIKNALCIFKELEKNDHLKRVLLISPGHHSFSECKFPTVERFEFYKLNGYDKLWCIPEMFPNLKELRINYLGDIDVSDNFKKMKSINHIIIKQSYMTASFCTLVGNLLRLSIEQNVKIEIGKKTLRQFIKARNIKL